VKAPAGPRLLAAIAFSPGTAPRGDDRGLTISTREKK
jgi:hypothetical protein